MYTNREERCSQSSLYYLREFHVRLKAELLLSDFFSRKTDIRGVKCLFRHYSYNLHRYRAARKCGQHRSNYRACNSRTNRGKLSIQVYRRSLGRFHPALEVGLHLADCHYDNHDTSSAGFDSDSDSSIFLKSP